MSGFFTHLRANFTKNWILWKRNPVGSICEILIPLLFALILIAFRSAIKTSDLAESSYLNMAYNTSSLPQNHISLKKCSPDWYVALSPNNAITNGLATILQSMNYNVKFFNSDDEIVNLVKSDNYGQNNAYVCFAVAVPQASTGYYQYNIRFNISNGQNEHEDIPDPTQGRILNLRFQDQDTVKEYYTSGFLQIQTWLDTLILQQETNMTNTINAEVTSVKLPSWVQDNIASFLEDYVAFYIIMPMIVPFLRLVYTLINEKETRARETMRMMGMSLAAYYVSWILFTALVYLVISIFWSLIALGMFKHSSFVLIFIWMYLYLLAIIPIAMIVSAVFSSAKIGVTGGLVVYFVFFILTSQVTGADVQTSTKSWASLSPMMAMGLASPNVLVFESFQYGLTKDTAGTDYNGYKVVTCMGFCILDFFIYLVIALYFDQVLPREYGVRKHPLFFLNPRTYYKCNRVQPSADYQQVDSQDPKLKDHVEEVEANMKVLEKTHEYINIANLRMVYDSGKVAVNDLSLKMYSGQIFALLGHNGAGKTTTISLMTGLYPQTSGEITIFGKTITNDMDEIRKDLGICPQLNVLYPRLTVQEHLEMFARFKGVSSDQIDEEVTKMMKDLDLIEKKDYLSENLSGGQKRKLCVGLAFIGGSKLIILDEPSSGMDTSARRKLWDMLKNYKGNRVVILTTHFMDEADYLGDRIAIIAEGQLRCCGRSLFLKSKYGVGYTLTVVKHSAEGGSANLLELVKRHVPEAKAVHEVSVEVTIQLPMDSSSKFQNMFEEMDAKKASINLESYGVSVTTLEEVFLRVAAGGEEAQKHIEEMKKSKTIKEQKVPDNDRYEVDIAHEHPRIEGAFNIFRTHLWVMILKRIWYFKRDYKALACEVLLPILFLVIGLCLMLITFLNDAPNVLLTPSMYSNSPLLTYYNQKTPTQIDVPNSFIENGFSIAEWNMDPISAATIDDFDQQIFNNRGFTPYRVGAPFFNTLDNVNGVYNYFVEVNTSLPESSPFMYNQINQAILRYATNNPTARIQATIAPFPYTSQQRQIVSSVSGLIGVFIFGMAYAFIPASLIAYIVKEREQNIKHQQIVSGVSIPAYWSSNWIIDITKHCIVAIVSALLVLAFSIDSFTEDDCYAMTWLLLLSYGPAASVFSYLMAFLFSDYGSAQTAMFFISFLGGFLGTLVIFILRIIDSTHNLGIALGYILRIFPNFSFCYGLMNMASREIYAVMDGSLDKKAAFSTDISLWDLLYLVFTSIIYFIIIFIIEKYQVQNSVMSVVTRERSVARKQLTLDEDVANENATMNAADPKDYAVLVKNLRKVYPLGVNDFKVAVENVSFGIKKGECFALLGVNGAGKTTTFKILSGEITPTEGNSFIAGHDTVSEIKKVRPLIGYCPQFDALLDLLTSREHLYIYAAIKGIPAHARDAIVNQKLKEMDLLKFADVPAGTYSGGNKRKLSVAMAMIGNPQIVLLDEPSSGMDPGARRFMWDIISNISTQRKESTIILTTHSMDEAEALSTKLAIQVDGVFKCMGSIQHIKNKFGKGYELEIKLKAIEDAEANTLFHQLGVQKGAYLGQPQVIDMLNRSNSQHLVQEISRYGKGSAIWTELSQTGKASSEQVVEFILIEAHAQKIFAFLNRSFGQFILVEQLQSFFRFKVETTIGLGKTFGLFEQNKEDLRILQYSLKQTSLEQIFNMFAAQKIAPDTD